MLIVWPPPPKLTPLLACGRFGSVALGSKSISSGESEKGNRPRASSIREMPRDQTSDLMVYGAPWMRSGWKQREAGVQKKPADVSNGLTMLRLHFHELTLIYVLVPTKVLAIELMSSPETPKSHILISPAVLARILDGLMSDRR
jgi:hypothetical protein